MGCAFSIGIYVVHYGMIFKPVALINGIEVSIVRMGCVEIHKEVTVLKS